MRSLVWLGLVGCVAEEVGPGPAIGGAVRSDPGGWNEAGLFASFPMGVDQFPCADALCVGARAAWLPSGELLVVIGVDASPEERPVTSVLAVLDASCSVQGSEDVRDTFVDIALDHLNPDDELGLSVFRSEVHDLLPIAPVTRAHAREARDVLAALDHLSELEALLADLPGSCGGDLAAVRASVEACLAGGGPELDDDTLSRALDLLDALDAAPARLATAMVDLACDEGTDVEAALFDGFSRLPSGDADRGSRLLLVSDVDGGDAAVAIADDAGADHVGLTVLGVTRGLDRSAATALAAAPGGLFLDAGDPSEVLGVFDERFDALLAPVAYGVTVEVDEPWEHVRVVGPTNRGGDGLASVFESRSHGVFGVVLSPSGPSPTAPVLEVRADLVDGPGSGRIFAPLPVGLLRYGGVRADDVVAMRFALLLRLSDALAAEKAGNRAPLDELRPILREFATATGDDVLAGYLGFAPRG